MWDGIEYKRNRRLRAIEYLGGKCRICGIADERVLEFHHRDPSLKTGTMAQLHYSLDEAEKCDLLCANCHKIVTYRDWSSQLWRSIRDRENRG